MCSGALIVNSSIHTPAKSKKRLKFKTTLFQKFSELWNADNPYILITFFLDPDFSISWGKEDVQKLRLP
jgi:hypothetical protein